MIPLNISSLRNSKVRFSSTTLLVGNTNSLFPLICALIPLVPGGHMYYTMLEVVKGNTDLAMYKAIDTCAQACSIAIGFILVSSIVRTYTHIKQRIGKHV